MSHLICTTHKQRVMVLDGVVIHRSGFSQCDTKTVETAGKKLNVKDVKERK